MSNRTLAAIVLIALTCHNCCAADAAPTPKERDWVDWIQAISWLFGSLGVGIAAWKLQSELSWRKADAGKSLNDEMQTDEYAWAAMQMIDSKRRFFVIDKEKGKRSLITREDVVAALNPYLKDGKTLRDADDTDMREAFIRDSFDALLYFFAAFNQYIKNKLIRAQDVDFPASYYIERLSADGLHGPVSEYIKVHKLKGAEEFLMRYKSWKKKKK